ncbi:aminoglycoside adenylyltransferase domain-containing protein [Sutcliffiella horikoshii]|uniref:aminoglycoside adenylyltransferase domain-containing protein n=1 Tax=Sutcliffiella horikoshii TaxID=79883 RepID=UPI001CFC4A78|nr:aminoglycoside adenylyltransferase domain-containing protein [Sutcliffiella horikoshii]
MSMENYFNKLTNSIRAITEENFIGIYIHGSLAMGGFNPDRSDVDILVVVKNSLDIPTQCKLAKFMLANSNDPYPIEVSFLTQKQLENWTHPSPYEFHFSEGWRRNFETELLTGQYEAINVNHKVDPDLAAHITILNHRGIRWEGPPIDDIFPVIPRTHYLSSILADFQDCLKNVEADPVYCVLNLIRVYWYVKEGVISSKLEAGEYGLTSFPQESKETTQKVIESYQGNRVREFHKEELTSIRDYIQSEIGQLEKESTV